MKIEGKLNCMNCNTAINWEHILPQNYNERFDVETFRDDISHPYHVSKIDNEYHMGIYCPKCGCLNSIVYK